MTYRMQRRYFPPSFQGKHNAVKSKTWLVLLEAQLAGVDRGLTTRRLSDITGSSSASLGALLNNWYEWKYVLRHKDPDFYRWKLSARGKKWLLRWNSYMPMSYYTQEVTVSLDRAIAWLAHEEWEAIGRGDNQRT